MNLPELPIAWNQAIFYAAIAVPVLLFLKLILQTDDGAAKSPQNLSNANMLTPPEGESPLMQMYG